MKQTTSQRTEIGLIPKDWSVATLGEKAKFRTGPFGSALHKSDYITGGIPIVNPMHIVDGNLSPSEEMTITEDAARRLSDFRLKPGEIIIGRRGDMGRCAVIRAEHDGWLCGTGSMIIRCGTGVLPEFIQRLLTTPRVVSAIEETSVGSTMINLNQGTLAGLKLQIPPEKEQQSIASALSDMDTLLAKLDQLIAKKRDIKQAAMQELLTGRRRLTGFSAAWVAKRIDKVAPLQRGFDLTHSEVKPGPYPVAYSNGIANHHAEFKAKGPGIATGRSGTIGNVHYIESDYWPHNTSLFVTNFHGNDPKFVYYLFQHTKLAQFSTGSGVPTLNRNDVHAHVVQIPQAHEEQSAVAQALTDIDTEITALEARREKTRLIKQGMMQELLSGRVRLI